MVLNSEQRIIEIIKYIMNWQKIYDADFTPLPTDSHSHLVFNHKNQIYRFIFSNERKRDKCRLDIPMELLDKYNYIIEQEDGFTYYLLIEGDY